MQVPLLEHDGGHVKKETGKREYRRVTEAYLAVTDYER
jgi:hypothetical protein